jgi:hypothetical protein
MPEHTLMWIERTPDEVKKWEAAAARAAQTHGRLVAVLSWLGITVVLAGGWIAGGRIGVVAQESVAAGSFWTRFPIFAAVGLPVAYWFFRREKAKELERSAQMTICPKCETAGEGDAGEACNCGGTFVLQSSVRWVDEPEHETHDLPG